MRRATDATGPSLETWLSAEVCPIAWADADRTWRVVTPAFAELLGATPGQLAGTKADDTIDPLRAGRSRAGAESGLPERVERIVVRAPREARLVYRSVPLLVDGQVVGWHDSLIDETPRTVLRRQVSEQAEATAQALRDKDQMVARVSHELRTPMTAIIGFCHMLLNYSGDLTETQRLYLQKVLKNASVQLQLLNNVLDLSRISSGTVAVMREPTAVDLVVAEAVESIEPQTWDRDLVVRQLIVADLPTVVTDRLKLKQILINLLSNAVKYTDAGEVVISVAPHGDGIEIVVRDTGIGIPEGQLGRIFEPYTKLHEGGRHGSVSSGLGLAIVKHLTAMVHAELAVTSTEGVGSSFTLRLPPVLPDDPAVA